MIWPLILFGEAALTWGVLNALFAFRVHGDDSLAASFFAFLGVAFFAAGLFLIQLGGGHA